MATTTRKERKALVLKQFRAVSALIGPSDPSQHCTTKDVKLDEHDIDVIIELAKQVKHIKLTKLEAVSAISDYYLTVIKPANPYIVGFHFVRSWDYGKSILKVFATIRINLKCEQIKKSANKKAQRALISLVPIDELRERYLATS